LSKAATPAFRAHADFVRALDFEYRLLRGACLRTVAHPLGEAFYHERLRRVWSLNALRLAEPPDDLDAVLAAVEELYAGYAHRRVVIEDRVGGARVAPAFRELGWLVEHNVYMALRRERDRPPAPGLAREVDEATIRPITAATMREEPFGRDEEVVQALLAHRAALAAAAQRVRYFVGSSGGVDAAVTRLYSDGRIAQVDDVGTLTAYRGRGLARATVSVAMDAALRMGHQLVFLIADAEDWPRDFYVKLGFEPIGYGWTFTKRSV
jgi:GNAT superfamily N-acetyltransferase